MYTLMKRAWTAGAGAKAAKDSSTARLDDARVAVEPAAIDGLAPLAMHFAEMGMPAARIKTLAEDASISFWIFSGPAFRIF